MVFIHLLRIQDLSFAMIKKRVFIRTGFKLENHLWKEFFLKKRKKETQTYFFRKRFLKPKLKHEKRVWLENVFDGFSHKRGFKVKNPCFLFILKNNVRRLFKEKSFFLKEISLK